MISRSRKRAILGIVFIGFFVSLAFMAVGRYFANVELQRRLAEENEELRMPEPLLHTVARQNLEQIQRIPAEILPWIEAALPAEVNGVVLRVHAEVGHVAEQDDVLLELDPTIFEMELASAQAAYEENQRLRQEAQSLQARNVAAATELAAAEAREQLSKLEVQLGQERLSRTKIRAPFAGVVNRRHVSQGDAVNAFQPVYEFLDVSQYRVVFFVPETIVQTFSVGAPVVLTTDLRPGQDLSAEVVHVARAANPELRLFRVEARLAAQDEDLPARISAWVHAKTARFEGLPVVPASAVGFRGAQAQIFVWDAETKKGTPQSVQLGPEVQGFYPVFSGVSEGAQIVIP
ncbi:MAG: efflux RND transporter periplasmic adaptor subunit [Verrucomicrobiales bacterium]